MPQDKSKKSRVKKTITILSVILILLLIYMGYHIFYPQIRTVTYAGFRG